MSFRKIFFQSRFILHKIKNFFIKNEKSFLFALIFFLLLLSFTSNYFLDNYNEFSELAWSFIHGKAYFLNQIENMDAIQFNNQLYWNQPPMPAIILMPIVFLAQGPIDQSLISVLANIIFFIVLYYFIRKNFHFSQTNSLWLTLSFFFASIYIRASLTATPYSFSHVLASLFIILSFHEYLNRKRYWLIGILIGLCFMTRYTMIMASLFYLIIIIFEKYPLKIRFKNLILFTLPLIIFILSSLGYNYIRFTNPFETGYKLSNFWIYHEAIRPYGMFSINYIPTNFYYYFLEGLQLNFSYITSNPTGITSFFIISPIYLFLLKTNLKEKIIKAALLTAGIIVLFLLCYYYNGGYPQTGSRYMIDALPFLFLGLLYTFKNIGLNYKHKLIIFFSIFLNFYLYYTLLIFFH